MTSMSVEVQGKERKFKVRNCKFYDDTLDLEYEYETLLSYIYDNLYSMTVNIQVGSSQADRAGLDKTFMGETLE